MAIALNPSQSQKYGPWFWARVDGRGWPEQVREILTGDDQPTGQYVYSPISTPVKGNVTKINGHKEVS